MPPTKSKYTKEIEKDGRIVTLQRAFSGKDYLDMWASDNGQEVLEQERLDSEAAAESSSTTQPARQ